MLPLFALALLSARAWAVDGEGFKEVFHLGPDSAAKAIKVQQIACSVPAELGAYALVLDVDGHGRQFGAPLVRAIQPVPGRAQFPAFALDICGWNCYPNGAAEASCGRGSSSSTR